MSLLISSFFFNVESNFEKILVSLAIFKKTIVYKDLQYGATGPDPDRS